MGWIGRLRYNYFQEQVDKIAQTIPSFGEDIQKKISDLTWMASELELSPSTGCLNYMGIFQVRVGEKQVVLACQNAKGEVSLNSRAIRQLKDPKYLGVVFLHEAFVRSMLYQYSPTDYSQAEFEMISKVVPYIISNQTLDPEKLYEHALSVRYVREQDYYNQYALEVFEDRRVSFQKNESEKKALLDQGSKLKYKSNKLYYVEKNIGCDGKNLESYMLNYFEVLSAYRNYIDASDDLLQSSVDGGFGSEVFVQEFSAKEELVQLKLGYNSVMDAFKMKCNK